jgi:hypothetical protein
MLLHLIQIRAHAQSLQCPFVIGYTESCTIHDDVCVISATYVINLIPFGLVQHSAKSHGLLCSGTAAVLKNWTRERPRKETASYDAGEETPNAASPMIPAAPDFSIGRKSPSLMQLPPPLDPPPLAKQRTR